MSDEPDKMQVLDAIRRVATELGHPPSRSEFRARTGFSENRILRHFPSWREAVRAAGLEPDNTNVRLDDGVLLADWGEIVRRHRHIPTRHQYRREGKYSPGTFEKHFGPWSAIPVAFREFAKNDPSWNDVLVLIPPPRPTHGEAATGSRSHSVGSNDNGRTGRFRDHTKLDNRPTYGDPIDFRGLRHEPVNEQGVVFLFGMVARELGYSVEAVQTGFPDCEAKRQVAPRKWQRVRIEFEFESRNYRDHGHPLDGCDVIVCWRHNWVECPSAIEVVELSSVIQTLAKSEE